MTVYIRSSILIEVFLNRTVILKLFTLPIMSYEVERNLLKLLTMVGGVLGPLCWRKLRYLLILSKENDSTKSMSSEEVIPKVHDPNVGIKVLWEHIRGLI